MSQRISIQIIDKIATCLTELPIVCGNSDYIAEFNFDEEWDSHLVKTARFKVNGEYTDVVFEGNECPIPIIPDAKIVWIGVFAGNLSTSTPAIVYCKRSILGGEDVPAPPREDVYSQIIALCEDAVEKAISVEERANNGEFKGEPGENGADGEDGKDYNLTEADKEEIASKVEVDVSGGTKGLAYALSADGTYYICTGLGTATDTDIVIANEYKGLPVKEIAEQAFEYQFGIHQVYIPENIERIGQGAFYIVDCKIIFAENSKISTIGLGVLDNSLKGCVIFPKSIKRIESQYMGDHASYPTSFIFKGTPNYISEEFVVADTIPSQYITDIYVPWAEGKVANAPWGCINATIHYQSPLCNVVTMDGFVGFEYVEKIKADVENIKAQMGDIDTALDELHNYAQALVNGGATV